MEDKKKIFYILAISSLPTGILSYYAHTYFKNSIWGFFVLISIMILLKYFLSYIFKIKEKWTVWFEKNGLWIFLFLSFIVWTIVFNIIGGL